MKKRTTVFLVMRDIVSVPVWGVFSNRKSAEREANELKIKSCWDYKVWVEERIVYERGIK